MVRFRTLALGTALTLPAVARADIPPDPDSADAHCTPAEQCPSGVYCDYAFRPGQPDGDWKEVGAACRADAEGRGLERRCRNGGNYGGKNLYCPRGEKGSWSPGGASSAPPAPTPASPTAPSPAKSGGFCSVRDASGASLLALLPLLALRRRRR